MPEQDERPEPEYPEERQALGDEEDDGFIIHDEDDAGYGIDGDEWGEVNDVGTKVALDIFGPGYITLRNRLRGGPEQDEDAEDEEDLVARLDGGIAVHKDVQVPTVDPAIAMDIPERLQLRYIERVVNGLEALRFRELRQKVVTAEGDEGGEKQGRWLQYLKWRSLQPGPSSNSEFFKWLRNQANYGQERHREPNDEQKKELEEFQRLVHQQEDLDLTKEAQWIRGELLAYLSNSVSESAGSSGAGAMPGERTVAIIAQLLRLIRFEHLEPPFILTYREEIWQDLTHMDMQPEDIASLIWRIDRLDAQWDHLEVRRRQVLKRLRALDGEERDQLTELAKNETNLRVLNDVAREIAAATARTSAAHGAELQEQKRQKRRLNADRKVSQVDGKLVDEDGIEVSGGEDEEEEQEEERVLRKKRPAKQWPLLKFVPELRGKADLFLEEYLLKPKEIVENMDFGGGYHVVKDPLQKSLEEAATELVCPACPDPKAVLAILRQEAAQRLGTDATLLKRTRELFEKMAVVSTEPTIKGVRDVDWTHEFASVKRITRKPVRRLLFQPGHTNDEEGEQKLQQTTEIKKPSLQPTPEHTQYLLMLKAEKEGYVKVKLEVVTLEEQREVLRELEEPQEEGAVKPDALVDELKQYYLSDQFSLSAQEWNEWRQSVLAEAVRHYLLPKAQRAMHQELVKSASLVVAEQAANKLREMANVVGYALPAEGQSGTKDMKQNKKKGGRHANNVMSVCMGEISQPSVFMILNRYGEVVDFLQLSFFKTRIKGENSGESQKTQRQMYTRRQKDVQNLAEFATKYRPERVVLAAEGTQARMFKIELELKLGQLSIKDHSFRVQWMDPTVARMFSFSPRGESEFGQYSPLMRQAIALGRHYLNPLAEVASLWFTEEQSQMREVMSLPLHPLQDQVDPRLLLGELEIALIKATYCLGVDINLIVERPWLAAPLQFVAGLGPKKAPAIIGMVSRMGALIARKHLRKAELDMADEEQKRNEAEFRGLGPVCYRNAIGFIRVSAPETRQAVQQGATKLDLTRIHPEDAVWYTQVIMDAVDKEDDEDMTEEDVTKVMDPGNRQGLLDLDLDAFADEEWNDHQLKVKPKLFQIQRELLNPFAHLEGSHRSLDFKEPGGERLFELLTGETKQTLRKGMLVSPTVRRLGKTCVYVDLDGLMGTIYWTELSDKCTDRKAEMGDRPSEKDIAQLMQEFVQPGMVLQTARVKRVKYENFLVELTTRSSSLRDSKANKEGFHVPINLPAMVCHCSTTHATAHGSCRCCKNGDFMVPCEHAWGSEPPPQLDTRGLPLPGTLPKTFHGLPLDPYLHHEALFGLHPIDKALLEKHEPKRGQTKLVRKINHPSFQNMTCAEAEIYLKDRKRGELVIRPSSKGYDYVTISYKVYNDPTVVYHTEVKELDKPNKMALGTTLQIDQEKFEDLDEVLARHIQPLIEQYGALLKFYKMYFGDEKSVMENLREAKEDIPTQIPYFFWQSKKYPGMFEFLYLYGKKTVDRDYIRVTPEGYRFNKHLYPTPQRLLDSCKKNIAEKLKQKEKKFQSQNRGAVRGRPTTAAQVPRAADAAVRALQPEGGWQPGMKAKGFFPQEGNWYTGVITEVLADGSIKMSFPNYPPVPPLPAGCVAPVES
eukprot:gb/GEZN01000245.1/.p1 GENE.gb/GEZN01000245.1/~~gb/GEZN01000245.1/.p1  ORF type:complete len:1774 (+),score=488.63 gb/GEZN01000245.1/:416-5323(+)